MPLYKRTLSEFPLHRIVLKHYGSNLLLDLQIEAKKDTLEYIRNTMIDAPYFEKHPDLVRDLAGEAKKSRLYLQIAVGRGKSIRWIGAYAVRCVYGLDCRDGIPEYWNANPIGAFSQKQLSTVPNNVEFQIGLFDETLPGLLAEQDGPVSFLYVDCDLYSATVTIFNALGPRLQEGAIVDFDGCYDFPRWQEHQYKLFQEFVATLGVEYEYIGWSTTAQQVAARILKNPVFSVA